MKKNLCLDLGPSEGQGGPNSPLVQASPVCSKLKQAKPLLWSIRTFWDKVPLKNHRMSKFKGLIMVISLQVFGKRMF